MATENAVSIDVWETHPKLRVGTSSCIISYLVERDTNFQARKGRRREFGSTKSDWIWGANPSMAKQEPGHWSTRLTRLIQFCHPSHRRARGAKYLLAGLRGKAGAIVRAATESIGQGLVEKVVVAVEDQKIKCPAQMCKQMQTSGSISLADFAALSANFCRLPKVPMTDRQSRHVRKSKQRRPKTTNILDSIAEEDDLDELLTWQLDVSQEGEEKDPIAQLPSVEVPLLETARLSSTNAVCLADAAAF